MRDARLVRNLPLPNGWPARLRSSVVHAVSLAHFSLTFARGVAANSVNKRIRQRPKRRPSWCVARPLFAESYVWLPEWVRNHNRWRGLSEAGDGHPSGRCHAPAVELDPFQLMQRLRRQVALSTHGTNKHGHVLDNKQARPLPVTA